MATQWEKQHKYHRLRMVSSKTYKGRGGGAAGRRGSKSSLLAPNLHPKLKGCKNTNVNQMKSL